MADQGQSQSSLLSLERSRGEALNTRIVPLRTRRDIIRVGSETLRVRRDLLRTRSDILHMRSTMLRVRRDLLRTRRKVLRVRSSLLRVRRKNLHMRRRLLQARRRLLHTRSDLLPMRRNPLPRHPIRDGTHAFEERDRRAPPRQSRANPGTCQRPGVGEAEDPFGREIPMEVVEGGPARSRLYTRRSICDRVVAKAIGSSRIPATPCSKITNLVNSQNYFPIGSNNRTPISPRGVAAWE